jgi:hypothetical protein
METISHRVDSIPCFHGDSGCCFFNVAGVWDSVLGVWKCRRIAGEVMLGWRGNRETVVCSFSKTYESYNDPPGAQ